jgi:hypothetical protein
MTLPAELLLPIRITNSLVEHPSICISSGVGREGFEPPKAVDRQIYSLLRLTASLPAQSVLVNSYWLLVNGSDTPVPITIN